MITFLGEMRPKPKNAMSNAANAPSIPAIASGAL
jgi:hypothetical protein